MCQLKTPMSSGSTHFSFLQNTGFQYFVKFFCCFLCSHQFCGVPCKYHKSSKLASNISLLQSLAFTFCNTFVHCCHVSYGLENRNCYILGNSKHTQILLYFSRYSITHIFRCSLSWSTSKCLGSRVGHKRTMQLYYKLPHVLASIHQILRGRSHRLEPS